MIYLFYQQQIQSIFTNILMQCQKKPLKVIENDLLYFKRKVKLPDNEDRRDK